jgi:hypothetical protein
MFGLSSILLPLDLVLFEAFRWFGDLTFDFWAKNGKTK